MGLYRSKKRCLRQVYWVFAGVLSGNILYQGPQEEWTSKFSKTSDCFCIPQTIIGEQVLREKTPHRLICTIETTVLGRDTPGKTTGEKERGRSETKE